MAASRPAACMLAAAVLLLAVAAPATAWGTGPWVNARATYYGRDAWALHTGSCGFGFICPNRWSGELASGYDVAAISDKSPLYNPPSSCGQCLEVACRSAIITDKYGVKYDRRGMCRGAPGSLNVKVKIVDTCPCSYAANAASNSRWCCGDYPHLDISEWSMRKLTDQMEQGVFAVSYRTVDCDAPIANEAKLVGKLMPDPHADMKPKSLNCATQGALTTESNAKVRAAVVKKPTPKPTRKLSAKLIAYRKALAEAKKHKHSPQFYKNLEAYFAKRGPDMKRLDGKPSAPFNAAGRKLR